MYILHSRPYPTGLETMAPGTFAAIHQHPPPEASPFLQGEAQLLRRIRERSESVPSSLDTTRKVRWYKVRKVQFALASKNSIVSGTILNPPHA